MITTSNSHPFALSSPLAFACLAAGLALAPGSAAAPAAGAQPEPKPYTLFMGADFDIRQQDAYHRVVDVTGSNFVIKVNGELIGIPTEQEKLSLKIQHALKLTEASAALVNLKTDRAYTRANDPRRKWAASSSGSDTGNATRQYLGAQAAVSANQAQASNPNIPAAGRAAIAAQGPMLQAAATSATDNFASANREAGSDMNNAGYNTMQMEEELAKGLFDAVEVTFEVSSETPLTSPYVVLVAQYHERNSPPGTARNWIYAKALEPIDSKARKVRLLQGGFPAGFELELLQVHLYNHGRELATNVAEKRVPLTYEDAATYLLIDYLSSHKDATLPATPALARTPAEARSRLGEQLTRTYYVRVSKDGMPMDAYLDEACSQKVDDPFLVSVINDLRFNPALEKGQPVEGTARLRLDALP